MTSDVSPDRERYAELCDQVDGEVSEEAVDRIVAMHRRGRGTPGNRPMWVAEQKQFPDHMDAVDCVLQLMVDDSHRVHPVEWIAEAADLPVDVCELVLDALALNGAVIPPREHGPDGYQINPYYDLARETHESLDRMYTPHELPSDALERRHENSLPENNPSE